MSVPHVGDHNRCTVTLMFSSPASLFPNSHDLGTRTNFLSSRSSPVALSSNLSGAFDILIKNAYLEGKGASVV